MPTSAGSAIRRRSTICGYFAALTTGFSPSVILGARTSSVGSPRGTARQSGNDCSTLDALDTQLGLEASSSRTSNIHSHRGVIGRGSKILRLNDDSTGPAVEPTHYGVHAFWQSSKTLLHSVIDSRLGTPASMGMGFDRHAERLA